jgi:transcriptional regulator with XRE-family HTH domain
MERIFQSWHNTEYMGTKEVGKYLAECRRAAGLTQRDVGSELGMTDRVVSDWERGVTLPSFDVMARMLRITGGRIEEAARRLLDTPAAAPAVAAGVGVHPTLLTALAGLPVDPTTDPDGRYVELAHQITLSPWLVERWDEITSLSQSEFHELMDYLKFRRQQRNSDRSNP